MSLRTFRRRGAPVALLVLVTFLSTFLPVARARADSPPPLPDITPTSHGVGGSGVLASPSGGPGSADALISTDPVTGASHAALSFDLPQARGAAQPSLSLSYTSGSNMGPGGMGWSLNLPSIERHNASGFPKFINWSPGELPAPENSDWPATTPTGPQLYPYDPTLYPDDFTLNGQALIPICIVTNGGTCNPSSAAGVFPGWVRGWTYYHPEEDSFVRAFRAPDYSAWLVETKSGVWLNFGVPFDNATDLSGLETHVTSISPTASPNAGVYRWDLTRQFDASFVNEVAYQWAALGPTDGEQPATQGDGLRYLTDIYDTSGSPAGTGTTFNVSQFAHHTHLFWRGHDTVLRYSPGWKSTPARVLGDVAVSSVTLTGAVGSTRSLVRLYHLGYTAEGEYEQRFLTSFQQYGCAATESNGNIADPTTWAYSGTLLCPKLPPTSFSYATAGAGVAPGLTITQTGTQTLPYTTGFTQSAMVDVNGDGASDILQSKSADGIDTVGSSTDIILSNGTQLWAVPTGGMARPGDLLPTVRSFWGDWLGVPQPSVLFINADLGAHTWISYPDNLYYDEIDYFVGNGDWKSQGPQETPPGVLAGVVGTDYEGVYIDETFWVQGKVFDIDGDGLTDVGLIPVPAADANAYASASQTRSHITIRPKDGTMMNGPFRRQIVHSALASYNMSGYHAVADMDADGLADIVEVEVVPDSGSSTFGPTTNLRWWKNRGDGRFGDVGNTNFEADTGKPAAEDVLVAVGPTWPVTQTGSNIAIGDVNGDSLADFVVLFNKTLSVYLQVPRAAQTGEQSPFAAPITYANAAPDDTSQVSIADTDGSGIAHVVLSNSTTVTFFQVQTPVPAYGLLTNITAPSGAQTTVTYDSVYHLGTVASPAWTSQLPTPTQVVVKSETKSLDKEPDGTPDDYVTTYAYANPNYEPRDHAFLGFSTVTVTTQGSAASPGTVTTTSYIPPTCPSPPCYGVDYGWRLRQGLPYAVQVSDASSGQMMSATVTTWTYAPTHTGLDGRIARMVYPAQVDTFPGGAGLGTTTWTGGGITGASSSDQTYVWAPPAITVPTGASGAVDLRRTQTLDSNGNMTQTVDFGQMGVDLPVMTQAIWQDASDNTDSPSGLWFRPTTVTTGSANATGTAFTDSTQVVNTSYNTLGLPVVVSAPLSGGLALSRWGATAVASTPSNASTLSGTVQLAVYTYDPYWNVTQVQGPSGRCTGVAYDTAFNQLPITVSAYRGGCGINALQTVYSYDRGLGAVTTVTDPTLAMTTRAYDAFGRLQSIEQPSTMSSSTSDSTGGVTRVDWNGYPNVLHVTTPARESYVYYDGFGRQRYRLDSAETAGQWILSGGMQLYPSGRVEYAYNPSTWSGATTQGAVTSFTSLFASATYDALGRVLVATGTNGDILAQNTYAPMSTTTLDGEQTPGGLHVGASTTVAWNGHGLTTSTVQTMVPPVARTVTSRATYTATGQLLTLIRAHSDGSDNYQRTLSYDSLGRLVQNVEPNTSRTSSAIGATKVHAWTYAYDDAGDLVGTTDARGCGENLAYDDLGRLVSEDYSPCTSTQAPYSNTPEVSYLYDVTDPGSHPSNAVTLEGRLSAVYDRAEHSQFFYDQRGRVTSVLKQLAVPGNATTLAAGYAPHWFEQDVSAYDEANRVVTRTTGIDPSLFGLTASTSLTSNYTPRNTVGSVTGSYGTLLASQVLNPDGTLQQQVYGDLAKTTADYTYKTSGQVATVHIHRPTGPWATASGYAPPTANLEDDLESLYFLYDRVGNPLDVDDLAKAAWPAGSHAQVARTMTYDDAYRMTSLTTQYAGSSVTDEFISPYLAEATAGNRLFPTAIATPNRVASQTYGYDWMGNTTSSTDDANVFPDRSLGTAIVYGVTNTGSQPQGPNWLTSATEGTSNLAATYDDAGEVLSISVQLGAPCTEDCGIYYGYTWDEVGRLATATRTETLAPGFTEKLVSEAFAYDASGQRVLKSYSEGTNAPAYNANIFDTLRLEGASYPDANGDYARTESDEIAFLAANGVTYGRAVYSQSDPTLSASGTLHTFLELGDHLGSTSFVIDQATSEVVERATYQGYGAPDSDFRSPRWSNFRDSFRYTGHEDDAEVGLVYFGARYYAPMLGRWMSADPMAIHGLGSDPNPYAFVLGSPLANVDPLGLQCLGAEQGCSDGGGSDTDDGGYPSGSSSGGGQSNGPAPRVATLNNISPPMVGVVAVPWNHSHPEPPPPPQMVKGVPGWVWSPSAEQAYQQSRAAFGSTAGGGDPLTDSLISATPQASAVLLPFLPAAPVPAWVVISGFSMVEDVAVDEGSGLIARTGIRAGGIAENKAAGEAWSRSVGDGLKADPSNVVVQSEITIETASGARTRADWVTVDAEGTVDVIEAKASAEAPLTSGQIASHPQIASGGGVVMGAGKPGIPGGTIIPPTTVRVVRP